MTLDAATLIDLHDIRLLKYRYMRGIDTYEWDLLHACFTADVTLWPSADSYIARGREEVVALMKASISDTYYSSHIVAQPEIELTGRDRATGKWRLEDIVYFTGTNAAITHVEVAPGQVLTGAGVYHDEYHRVDGRWLIASCGYVRIFETVTNRGSATMQVTPDPRRGMAPPPLN